MNRTNSSKDIQKRLVPKIPLLNLVIGVPDSGKTALAKQLLSRLACMYLDNNFIADAFFKDTRTDSDYKMLRPRLYDVLYRITEENLAVGNSVLLDVPHITHVQRPEWRDYINSIVERHSARLIVLRCWCKESVLKQRISSRGEKRDVEKLEHWNAWLKGEPIRVFIPFEHLDIATDTNEDILAMALQYIASKASID